MQLVINTSVGSLTDVCLCVTDSCFLLELTNILSSLHVKHHAQLLPPQEVKYSNTITFYYHYYYSAVWAAAFLFNLILWLFSCCLSAHHCCSWRKWRRHLALTVVFPVCLIRWWRPAGQLHPTLGGLLLHSKSNNIEFILLISTKISQFMLVL